MNIINEYEQAKRNAEEEEAIDMASEATWKMLANHLMQHQTRERISRSAYINIHTMARRQPFVFKDKDTLLTPFSVRVDRGLTSDGWEAVTAHTAIKLAHPRGGEMMVRLLPPVEQSGPAAGCLKHVNLDPMLNDEEGVKQLAALLPDLPPSIFDTKTMRGFRPVEAYVDHSSTLPVPVACSGRPVATINKWLKRYDLPPIDTETTNRWLAQVSTILSSKQYTVEWIPKGISISEVYSAWEGDEDEDHPELGSCMSGQDDTYFEMYDDLQRDGVLTMMLIKVNGRHCGRALVWIDGGQYYLDRVYCVRVNSAFPERAVSAVKDFLAQEKVEKCVYHTDRFSANLSHRVLSVCCATLDNYNCVPYVDSLRFWYSDGILSSRSDRSCHMLAELTNTDGSLNIHEEEEEITVRDIFDEDIPEDDATYLPYYSGYIRSCDVCYTTYDGGIHDDHVYYLDRAFYLGGATCHRDNAVETYANLWIYEDHAVTLDDGRIAHESETYTDDDDKVRLLSEKDADASAEA